MSKIAKNYLKTELLEKNTKKNSENKLISDEEESIPIIPVEKKNNWKT